MTFDSNLLALGSAPNIMRELAAYGHRRAAVIGADKVLDFSLGNPSAPVPPQVVEAMRRLAGESQGYTPADGDPTAREQIAAKLSARFGKHYGPEDLVFTLGATGALCMCFRALSAPDAEVVLPAPFFSEYTVFAQANGCKTVVVPPVEPNFGLNLPGLEAAITPHTRAVVVNLPNNPTGAVYTSDEVRALTGLLRRREAEYGHPIYLISDEPYRELAFDGVQVPWFPDWYDDTLICYSYSKSLSLPGARIGYLLVNPAAAEREALWGALRGAGRVLGYISAPRLFQFVAAECEGLLSGVDLYRQNRDLLYNSLISMGYTCPKPAGTFYLFLKAPEGDGTAFALRAVKKDLLVAPGAPFLEPRYVRIALCCPRERVERSLPVFEALRQVPPDAPPPGTPIDVHAFLQG